VQLAQLGSSPRPAHVTRHGLLRPGKAITSRIESTPPASANAVEPWRAAVRRRAEPERRANPNLARASSGPIQRGEHFPAASAVDRSSVAHLEPFSTTS
jgi:hypothetical protein